MPPLDNRFQDPIQAIPQIIWVGRVDGWVEYCNQSWFDYTGTRPEETVGWGWKQAVHAEDQDLVREKWRQAVKHSGVFEVEGRIRRADGSYRWHLARAMPLLGGSSSLWLGTCTDIHDLKQANDQKAKQLADRARRQAAIAEFGQYALATVAVQPVMDQAVVIVAQTLGTDCCKVLELLPEGRALLLRAGVGWANDQVGYATVSAGENSQAGYTLLRSEPVVVDDLRKETRFSGPPLLRDHGVISGMSVIIGNPESPIGVLGAHTRSPRKFTLDDVQFLQAIANIIAHAWQRQQTEAALLRMNETQRMIMQASPAAIVAVDRHGKVTRWNRAAERMFGWEEMEVLGKFPPYVPSEALGEFQGRFERIMKGEVVCEDEVVRCRKDGSQLEVLLSAAPLSDATGQIQGSLGVLMDITEHKRAKALREELAKRDQALVRAFAQIVYDWRPQADVVIWEGDFTRLLGYTLEEMGTNTQSWTSRVHPDDLAHVRAEVEDATRGRRNYLAEYRFRHRDGSYRWMSDHGVCFFTPQGELERIIGVFSDITERKRAEEAVRQSEEKFRVLAETSASAICVLEAARFLYVNPASEAISGYTREELLRMTPFDLVHPAFREEVERRTLGRLRGESFPAHVEFCIISKSGDTRWLDFRVSVIPYEGSPAILATAFDVTERVRAEQALRANHVLLQAIVEGTNDGISVKDLEGRYLMVNSAGAGLLGRPATQVIGSTNHELLPPEVARTIQESERRVIQCGKSESLDVVVQLGGITKTLMVTKIPYRDHSGAIVGVIGIARDLTEHAQLEGQLRQAQKLEALGQLVDGIAHNFNNTLTGITLFAGMLKQKVPRSGASRRYVDEIVRAADRGSRLVSDLLAFSRQEPSTRRLVNLNEVLLDQRRLIKQLMPENIKLTVSLGDKLGLVRIDDAQIGQALINLALNARDAMPRGGKLAIETANVRLDDNYTRRCPGMVPGPYVVLSVSDTGKGMRAETKAHLFEPFFTTKPEGQGTGLGLATVYGMVKQNGGHISVYSEEGIGTTFRIYLPMAPVGLDEESIDDNESRGRIHERPVRSAGTILLVEDEPAIRDSVREYLAKLGYRVLSASDGLKALRVARVYKQRIDLILTDVVMPGLSGAEMAGQIKAIHPETKVLYMSGYTGTILADHIGREEGSSLLSKPFTLEILSGRIRQALGNQGRY